MCRRKSRYSRAFGGGDCGYPFQTGTEYVIYAYKNSDGRLETGICSRTRPLAEAGDDVAYFHSMASAPATGTLRVQTGIPVCQVNVTPRS